MTNPTLHLGAFMRPVGIHTAAWRYPGAYPDANFNFQHLKRSLRRWSAAGSTPSSWPTISPCSTCRWRRCGAARTVTSFEPLTLLSALAGATERIGLIATASTTFDEPYHIARRFASLDHISGGRAGWNIVTTSNPDAALNFGLEDHVEHDERYRRAREFYDVVTGLWDSLADDAFVSGPRAASSSTRSACTCSTTRASICRCAARSTSPGPIQGWPVIVQAGASEAGRQLAAETAEVIFAAAAHARGRPALLRRHQGPHEEARARPGAIEDLARRASSSSATPSRRRGRRRRCSTASSIPTAASRHLSIALGVDASSFDLDGPLPEIPGPTRARAGASVSSTLARARQSHRAPTRANRRRLSADCLRRHAGDDRRRDGAMARERGLRRVQRDVPYLPEGLDDFVDKVVPELQRRGLFRREYEGTTLRENLGLPRPENQFFPPPERSSRKTA